MIIADDPRYKVVLPTGTEGPYTRDDLRQLAESGRVRSDDRVQDLIGLAELTVEDVVPGAAASRVQARVRRSSDRLPVQKLPVPKPRRTPAAGIPVGTEAVVETAQYRRTRRLWMAAVPALVVLIPILCVVVVSLWPRTPPLDPGGLWRFSGLPGHAGTWQLAVTADDVTIIAPDARKTRLRYAPTSEEAQMFTMHLARAHPVLGQDLRFEMRAGKPWLSCGAGAVAAEREEPDGAQR